MATSVCQYYQVGYCKFGLQCRNIHVEELCPDRKCSDRSCSFRHPHQCKYLFMSGHCKFEDRCAYYHNSDFMDLTEKVLMLEIENVKNFEVLNSVEDLQEKIKSLEAQINEKDVKIASLEATITKSILSSNQFTESLVARASDKLIKSFTCTVSKIQENQQKSLSALNEQIGLLTNQLLNHPTGSTRKINPVPVQPRNLRHQVHIQQQQPLLQTPSNQPLLPTPFQPPLLETPPITPLSFKENTKHSRNKKRMNP